MEKKVFVCLLCISHAIVQHPGSMLDKDFHQLVETTASSKKNKEIVVFYHVYNVDESTTVAIVNEQLGTVQNSTVFGDITAINMVTFGKPFESFEFGCLKCTHVEHYTEGKEDITLAHLYEHCTAHPTTNVFYMHSKGSYHKDPENLDLRHFPMHIFSTECLKIDEMQCDTCSSRFSPLPHPHTPGNMWLATCTYINQLLPPANFNDTMQSMVSKAPMLPFPKTDPNNWCIGFGPYSAEHWVHSHPTVRPCDLYEGPYYYGNNVPKNDDWIPHITQAPRYSLNAYNKERWDLSSMYVWRMYEWTTLYNKTPSKGSALLKVFLEPTKVWSFWD